MTENNLTIGVVGAGQMGSGIAQVCAMAGMTVLLNDVSEQAVARGIDTIAGQLDRLVTKDKLSASARDEALRHLKPAASLEQLAQCDCVIEAATENETLKLDIFRRLDAIVQPNAVLASNTSSISITRIAAATQRPDKVIGMHFMNPVPVMPLIEVIRGLHTSDAVCQAVTLLAKQIGKVPVEVKDGFGFVANRLLIPMINEAIFCLYEGLASAEDIDTVMKLGANHPIGPLALADLIGLDTCLAIMAVLHEGFDDSKYRPCPLLKQMVDAGLLGRKTGQGFFRYNT
ncbi:3-hydroxybutyryl-CoA dehydrogenase [Pseudogulbenkiania subflava]|uniref:3-hydroxyacyl-CoA dehydrogenase n=1 Tax=Pseudogulbenkiania subflava DSM 22618 TaxID=1123014 RepID=A0A1Y6C8P4_9NEIS|nr:3-hydroxybutyryl-CoA dehydrogenase [Pseudogulbenkiania subflava]SMF48527.1 3-hydroxyacyl-CoA dehydrogenase [Pseudogulbenkiania subflava DSM 22618]